MQHKFLKMIICTILLFCSMMMQAEFGDENPGTDMEDEFGEIDEYQLEAATPVDTSLIYLAFAGTAFAFYYYKSNRAQRNNQG